MVMRWSLGLAVAALLLALLARILQFGFSLVLLLVAVVAGVVGIGLLIVDMARRRLR